MSAAEDALYAGSFMTRPSLWTVQAIAILSLCGHNVCDSDLLSSLLAVGIKMAQSLGLHSLGRRSRAIETKQSRGVDLSGHLDVTEVVDVEMGKRVWWALVLEDWFAIPFRGVWGARTFAESWLVADVSAIHPDQMDTPMPYNCHSEDLQVGRYMSRGDGIVTIAQSDHVQGARNTADLQEASLFIAGCFDTPESLSGASLPKDRVSQPVRPSAYLIALFALYTTPQNR